MKYTLTLSATCHVALIALLLLLPVAVTVSPKLDLSKAIAVVFAPPLPPTAPAQPEPPPAQPQIAEQPPPPPEPPPTVEQPLPPPAPVAETRPPSPLKPEPHPVPKPRPRPQPVQQAPPLPLPQPMPQLPLPLPSPMPQTASIPSPPPAPTISPDYRMILSSWLQTHKRYPEEARQRGEEGRAVLRFRVDRRVRADHAVG